ncbi:MAG TPA: hypothetical protein VF057_03025 [Thermoanaerobaculia bacterium]
MTPAEIGSDSADATQRLALAAFLSALFHPFLLIPFTIVALTRDLRLSALVAAATVLPLLAITLAKLRRGSWGNFDVSDRRQRVGLYAAAIPLTLAGAVLFSATGAPRQTVQGTLVVAAMLVVAFVLSRYVLKVSLHLLFAGWAGVLLGYAYPPVIAAVPLVLIALGWARRHLERHTRWEVITGAVIGLTGGAIAVLLP